MIDLGDTSNRPTTRGCARCGHRCDVEICTITTPIGVRYQPMCADRVSDGAAPRVKIQQVTDLVMRHCPHLGIDLDQMASAIGQEGSQ